MFGAAKYDQAEYNQHFAKNSYNIRAGPVPSQSRSCNDVVCLVIFILIIVATIVLGIIMINDGKGLYNQVFDKNSTASISGVSTAFSTQGGIIIAMFFLSIILSIIFLFLIKTFPRGMVYSMIGLIYLVFIALIVLGIINRIWWMVATFAVTLLIISCILFCFRRKLNTGILLLQVGTAFISEKPSVFLAPLYPLVFGIMFFVFWVFALVSEAYYLNILYEQRKTNSNISTSKQQAFIAVWIAFFIFMIQFFSYVQTFLVSTCCAYWYYGVQANYCFNGVKVMNRFHLGSITFAALLITIITILRNMSQQAQSQQQSTAASICFCLVSCCLKCIEDLLHTLNNNAIIVMSVTGESYIDSAKTALSLIFSQFGLFTIIDFITGLVTFFGILICVGIPTLVGFLIVRYPRNQDEYVSSYSAVTIFFMSILVSGIIISMIEQAVSCVFIFYCFDKKFRNMGIVIPNSPPAIRQFLQYGQFNYEYRGRPDTEQEMRNVPNF